MQPKWVFEIMNWFPVENLEEGYTWIWAEPDWALIERGIVSQIRLEDLLS